MKSVPVKDVKRYEAVNGIICNFKREAAELNVYVARRAAVKALLVKYLDFHEISPGADSLVEFIATHGDEVIEALTEESST